MSRSATHRRRGRLGMMLLALGLVSVCLSGCDSVGPADFPIHVTNHSGAPEVLRIQVLPDDGGTPVLNATINVPADAKDFGDLWVKAPAGTYTIQARTAHAGLLRGPGDVLDSTVLQMTLEIWADHMHIEKV